ncbi:hypothetical protein Pse7367_0889 [Thalassoporum mexicanum PCC 7367]|uniref:hypothetical protein n=1 Tax=Thalassoporum mexicanum TaxID=3457544 RepID=UPI00029FF534|nr:hypothetical protein [Pseudanabaena sp. PCC 7367]AFY69189.1 hypothetical protein Pse7367_0889 [Pseudanabaena sp. PCC 7367]
MESLPDILPLLQDLSRTDKFKAIQFLLDELEHEEDSDKDSEEVDRSIWSTEKPFAGSEILLQFWKSDQGKEFDVFDLDEEV